LHLGQVKTANPVLGAISSALVDLQSIFVLHRGHTYTVFPINIILTYNIIPTRQIATQIN
jgi:hypothetical protein